MSRPPRLAQRLLLARLAPDERDELIGDLNEQFATEAARRGARAARRWYWAQTLALVWGFTARRRDLISTEHARTRGSWLAGNLRVDWRHAVRSLRHARGFALVTLLTLAFGIGLSTVFFSMLNGILLQPLPVPDADRIVRIGQVESARENRFSEMINTGRRDSVTLRDVSAGVWIQTSDTLEAFAEFATSDTTVRTPAGPLHLTVGQVGPRFFDVYRLTPVTGRLLQPADDLETAPPVALITDRFWTERLGRRPDVLDLTLGIADQPMRIAGVIPPTLDFLARDIDVFVPGRFRYPDPASRRMFSMSMNITARLAPGSTLDQVRAEGQRVLRTVAMARSNFVEGVTPIPEARVQPLADEIVEPVRPALTMLGAGMAGVLIAMCTTIASLLLARNTARRQEIAMRLALGADRWRLVRPLVFEQLLLGACGAALGAAAALAAIRLLPHVAPADLPRLAEIDFDVASLAFAASAALVTALVVGLLPAWQMPSRHLREIAATPRGAGGTRVRSALVVLQVAMATVLLVGAALVGHSLLALVRVDPGYDPEGVLTFQVAYPDTVWDQRGRLHQFFDDLLARLEATPGVVAAGVASALPLHIGGTAGTVTMDGRPMPPPDERPRAQRLNITHGYPRAIGMRLVNGRFFDARDTALSEPVCLVNDVFAARYFPGEDIIGQRLNVRARVSARIVGIVASARIGPLSTDPPPAVIQLAAQQSEVLAYCCAAGGVAIRTTGDPLALAPAARAAVRDLAPDWPIHNVEPLEERLGRTFAQPRFYTIALALFAALTIATAVLGLYGVLWFSVERRRLEFGIRRALGAGEGHIVLLATRRAAWLAAAGLALGLTLAVIGARLLDAVLFGVHPLDPASYALAIALIAAVAMAAAWLPARRALRVDPARALRVD